jgi:hypothetical protein
MPRDGQDDTEEQSLHGEDGGSREDDLAAIQDVISAIGGGSSPPGATLVEIEIYCAVVAGHEMRKYTCLVLVCFQAAAVNDAYPTSSDGEARYCDSMHG